MIMDGGGFFAQRYLIRIFFLFRHCTLHDIGQILSSTKVPRLQIFQYLFISVVFSVFEGKV